MKLIVTGGAGFIGSAVVRQAVTQGHEVVNLDALTYAGNLENLLYIPMSFACWMTPIIGILYAWTGLFSPKASEAERADWQQHGRDITDMSDYGYERPDFGTDAKAAPAE